MRLVALIFLMIPLACFAGRGKKRAEPDSVLAWRDLGLVMRGWQKAPLQAGIKMVRESNGQMADEDTSMTYGEFWLSDSITYMRMGAIEQMVSGGMALMVNHSIRRMLVFEDALAVTKLMMASTSGLMQDTSLAKLSAKYRIERSVQTDTMTIRLTDRTTVDADKLSQQELIVQASSKSMEPYSVITIRRLGVTIDSATAAALRSEEHVNPESLVTMPDRKKLLIRENRVRIDYLFIRHETDKFPEVSTKDWLAIDAAGKYHAVGACRGYTISKELL